MKKIELFIIVVVGLLLSCSNNKDTVKMTIASETRTAMGAAPMEVMLVKEGDASEWLYFYSNIEGFDYEPGYEYVLEVKKENIEGPLPADASSIKYTLVKEISKTKTTSANLPENVVADKDIVRMVIASEKRTAMGVAPIEVLLVKEGDASEWSYFYSNIEGFNYEPGYEYILDVKKENIETPLPADVSSIKYTLVKEISKTETTSANLPENINSK